ncbi:MAG: hypothetical protein RLZZ562_1807 [Planctomycetota bacterium]|jgi:hypothetical protein
MKSAALFAGLLLACFACSKGTATDPNDHNHEQEAAAPTNRIDAPELVRRNLGIRFAPVERRRVAATLRLPGRFELLPQGRQDYRTPIAGRVQVKAQPMQRVEAGDVLYEIDAPEWLSCQRRLHDLTTERGVTAARLDAMTPLLAAHEAHEQSLQDAQQVMRARIEQLTTTQQEVGGQAEQMTAARLQLSQVSAQLAEASEKHANLIATLAELRANTTALESRFAFEIDAAAAIAESTTQQLLAQDGGEPRWRTMRTIAVRARNKGIVAHLPAANGAWAETSTLLAEVVDIAQMQFVAQGLQSDLPRLQNDMRARVVPAGAASADASEGTLHIGIEADPQQRTVALYVRMSVVPTWARPEVAAFVEIEIASGAAEELAVPTRAVLQDGLSKVFFRRSKDNPDVVIRCDADLGVDDGRFVEVKSGLTDGDEIVVDGAYELVLATSGSQQKGGHFHADGTFHSEEDH